MSMDTLRHQAIAYYRRCAEDGGYLRDFRMESHPLDRTHYVSATAVATGQRLTREINRAWLEPIDDSALEAIDEMRLHAKSLCGVFEPEPDYARMVGI